MKLIWAIIPLILFGIGIQQSFADVVYTEKHELDFENCEGILDIEEVKSVIMDIGEITVRSRGLMPVDEEPGLQTMCNSTFESLDKSISMTIVVMESSDTASVLYEKNLDSMSAQDFEIRKYLTFWNNFDVVLNDQGLGSFMASQYDKFFISFHTSFDEDNTSLIDVEELRVLSTIVQKKILDLDEVSISPPNPLPDNDVGPTTYEHPPKPSIAPIAEGELLSPKKQVSQGIDPVAVKCNEGLVLIIKHNGSPACVRPDTAENLEERSWGNIPPPCCKNMPHKLTTEVVLGIAQEFIKFSPTFAFDGMDETLNLELVVIRESFPEQYVIEADFDSLHGGYGDRTDQMIDQAITPHSMNLVVIDGKVTSAILDGKWDELNQLQLPGTPTKGPNETVSHENVKEFSLVYTKEGGIAGISESIIINSPEKTLIKRTAQGQTEILLDESQISSLLDTINEAELLSMGSLVYAPAEGWADYFTYTLRVMSGDVESNITWTDTNDVPEDLVLISQQIEEIIEMSS